MSSVQARCVIVLQISVEPEGLKMKEPMYSSNLTIPGVIVRAVLTNELHSNAAVVQTAIVAQTDPQGQFAIAGAPVGLVKILVDGSTAPPAGTYPVTEYDLVTVAGQNNTVGQRSISWRSADPVP